MPILVKRLTEHTKSPRIEQTPLHELIEATEDDEIGLAALKENLNDWKNHINTLAPNKFQESALHMLVTKGFYRMAEFLIDNGANIRAEDSEKTQPLHLACKGGNVEFLNLLLSNDAPIDHLDSDGYLPLHWASRYGCDAIIPQLLGPKNAFLNQRETASGQTPLNLACWRDQTKVVEVLLERHANLGLRDNDGWTPLFTAVLKCNYDTLRILMNHLQEKYDALQKVNERPEVDGKVCDIPDNEGTTPLMQLCANAYRREGDYQRGKDFIQDLLKLKPDITAKDNMNKTALHIAIKSAVTAEDTSIALQIIERVANGSLLARDSDGYTAFDIVFDGSGPVEVLHPVLETLISRLNPPDTDIENVNKDLLYWTIEDVQRHTLAEQILSGCPAAKNVPEHFNSQPWRVMEWVTYYRLPGALFQYIMVCSEVNGFDEGTLESDAERCRDVLDHMKKEPPAETEPPEIPSRDVNKGKKHNDATHHTDRKSKDDENRDIQDMEEILDLCFVRIPPKRVETLNLLEPDDKMSAAVSDVRATVLQSYESFGIRSQVYRFRPLKDIVYGTTAIETYTETVDRMRSKLYKPKDLPQTEAAEAMFTWIHLPSVNVRKAYVG